MKTTLIFIVTLKYKVSILENAKVHKFGIQDISGQHTEGFAECPEGNCIYWVNWTMDMDQLENG